MRLILFDVDGTLVDSQDAIVAAQTAAFAAHDMPPPTRQKALSVVGLSLIEAFHALAGADAPLDSLATAYKSAWSDLRAQPGFTDTLFPGAAASVAALSRVPDTRLGIVTGKSVAGVERILAAQGWAGTFATIQTADTHPSKPHPSMVLTAMAETHAFADATFVIGDTTYDMAMARAAGVRAIGVAWGYHPVDALLRSGAAAIAESFGALQAILDRFVSETA